MSTAIQPAGVGRPRSTLVINRGSSNIKFALYVVGRQPVLIRRGSLDVAESPLVVARLFDEISEDVVSCPLASVGHRIVHGGPAMRAPQAVTPALLSTLHALVRFAPNHLPGEIALIEAVQQRHRNIPQIVCFDTAFHADLPDVATHLPIAHRYAAEGVRRYGFHGLSYTFLMEALGHQWQRPSIESKVILAHLGSGSSLAAVRDGRPIDTSMGFTPIGGVVMSTRSGDLDPGVVAYIARTRGFDADQLEQELSQHSGLFGLTDGTADMRELLRRETSDDTCRLAVSIYCYEIRKRIGAYAAAMGGLHAIVFSGGIGERAPTVRSRICQDLMFLGVEIDDQQNAANAPTISRPNSSVSVFVIPTDEEVVIATASFDLLHDTP